MAKRFLKQLGANLINKFVFHPEAKIELENSIDYYEECKKDLGFEFANEVYLAINRAMQYPNAWQILDGNIRRCLVKRFPFGVIYIVQNNTLIILAIMQLNKKPNYWNNRK